MPRAPIPNLREGKGVPIPAPYQILCLSGGGYRGLFTAIVLEKLEEKAGRPLATCFDMISGTSIGGILACGLAAGVQAKAMREAFEKHGEEVFDRHLEILEKRAFPIRFGFIGTRYSNRGLRKAIGAVLGERRGTRLGDIHKPLLIPAVSATNGRSVLFESGIFAGQYGDVTLENVTLATSAAPTYFPDHAIDKDSMVDGGLVANAPDTVALIKAMGRLNRSAEQIKILSVGTSGAAAGEVFKPGRASGGLRWLIGRGLFDLTLAAQQDLSVAMVERLLDRRYLRIDIKPDKAKGKVIGLDKVTRKSSDALEGLAREALRLAEPREADLAAMLRHQTPATASGR